MAKQKRFPKNDSEAVKQAKRYLGVLTEDTNSKFDMVIEQFGGINNKLDEHTKILGEHTKILDSHTKMIGGMAQDIETIKNDITFLKGGFKKKVDYDEFLALGRRVSLLESRVRR